MFGLGFSEIIFLAVLALIVIGPKQLPEVARTIGRFLNELKRSTESLKEDIKLKVDLDLDQKRETLAKKQVVSDQSESVAAAHSIVDHHPAESADSVDSNGSESKKSGSS